MSNKPEHPDVPNADHPFRAGYTDWPSPRYAVYQRVPERLECVKEFDLEESRRALKVENLQRTVRQALRRRIKKLESDA